MGYKSRSKLASPCRCSQFLDPFSRIAFEGGAAHQTLFPHFCYVCNTQLNSCRQTLTHSIGQKHQKRLRHTQLFLLNHKTSELHPLYTYDGSVPGSGYYFVGQPMNTYGSHNTSTTCTRSSYSGSGGSGVVSPPPSTADGNSTRTETNSVISNASYQDPVTKAVVENIIPTKTKMSLSCDICKLEFSSQVPLDMHLMGSKHAKRMKSQEILQNLKQGGQTFHQDVSNNVLRCEICDVVVNSSQQLQTHLTGNKHRATALKRGADDNGSEELAKKAVYVLDPNIDKAKPNGEVTDTEDGSSGIRLIAEGSANKSGKFFCETCNVTLNSEIQLQQHTGSKKHKDKLMGVKKPPMKTKKSWFWAKKKKGNPGIGFVLDSEETPDDAPPGPGPQSLEFIKGDALGSEQNQMAFSDQY